MSLNEKSVTTLIDQKRNDLAAIRRDMGGISQNLMLWKTLDDKAKRLEREIATLSAIRLTVHKDIARTHLPGGTIRAE